MYNTDLPRRVDLPTSAQLKRSTLIAAVSACVILLTMVLPSEYAVDPTGVGRVLGLTQMGEIKTQLAQEAAQDAAATASANAGSTAVAPELTARLDRIETALRQITATRPAVEVAEVPTTIPELAQPAEAPEETATATDDDTQAAATAPAWKDEISFTLAPGEGVEVKLVMTEGARASFHWTANGAVVNYDTHGDGGGNSVSYEKGRSVPEQEGVLQAAFTGNHGWFWRNRTSADVTLTLRTNGDYSDIKRMM